LQDNSPLYVCCLASILGKPIFALFAADALALYVPALITSVELSPQDVRKGSLATDACPEEISS
jgi:hypothetical protein